ncbi:MAG: penicillin-binding protein 1C [Cytophagales bacterium]|nr:MAG: penicillin-binding protein 1C [Cytophagales bacterium]TAF59309.1 MAG: penicillin-binding protein 1C [Cytophagales bacterium]
MFEKVKPHIDRVKTVLNQKLMSPLKTLGTYFWQKPFIKKIAAVSQKAWGTLPRPWRVRLKNTFWTLLGFFLSFLILDLCFPLPTRLSYSQVILSRKEEVLHVFLSQDDKWRLKCELQEISPILRNAIIFKEDKYFYYHFGINPFAIVRAAVLNVISARRTSGASTITMQVARLLEPKPRTYWHKMLEIFRAWQLEWHFSKDEILQMYLNLVPYGGNVEGVKSAARLYFQQNPAALSLAQVTALTIIPNRPSSLAFGQNDPYIEQERNKWLKRFAQEGLFEADVIEDALKEPLNAQFKPMPKLIPHLARRLASEFPSQHTIKSTIDMALQSLVEKIVLPYSQKLKFINIHNAAVIVTDSKTAEIRAYLGSPDFDDALHAGQVDGNRAVRSPGSALKPLLYAMAFEEGLLTPKMKVSDVTVDYDGYMPENFDGKFHGEVSVEDALAYSLNVPAVKTLHEMGAYKMVERLCAMNFRTVEKQRKYLGLSVALGGCGVSLEEMCSFYTALANNGLYRPLRYEISQNNQLPKKQVIAPEAVFMTNHILTTLQMPDMPSDFRNSEHVPQFAWKTGTSYGRRDAWSLGFNKNYCIGVWIGNFSGVGAQELTGAGMATPLLFKLFTTLDYDAVNEWMTQPDNLKKRLVCSETGKVPEDFCQNLVMDYFIPGISKAEKCSHLKYVFVSNDEALSYCNKCLPSQSYIKGLYPNLSSEMMAYNLQQGIPFKTIPAHNPLCGHVAESGAPPKIISPAPDRTFFMQEKETQLALFAQVSADASSVSWFINDVFLKKAKPSEKVFFKPPRGVLKISCTDDKGRNTNCQVTVR